MSGTTIVASTLPVAVLCTAVTHPEGVEPYSVAIVGNRDPGAVHGTGITYDVDLAAFNEWIGANPSLLETVTPVTQAEVDAMADAQDKYGYELGLVPPEEGGAARDAGLSVGEARNAAQIASHRLRQADSQIRQADMLRKQADEMERGARDERGAAEEAQRRALAIVEEKQQALRPVDPRGPHPDQQPAHEGQQRPAAEA